MVTGTVAQHKEDVFVLPRIMAVRLIELLVKIAAPAEPSSSISSLTMGHLGHFSVFALARGLTVRHLFLSRFLLLSLFVFMTFSAGCSA